ncbi:MAG: hypothetical protein HY343_07080 [Lentisphaerae bacterium]|nr:hypothetical protein [Lentisphaerota bacterium]
MTNESETIAIGSNRQLFVDDYVIDTLSGARRKLHPPVRRERAIALDHPWEAGGVSYMVAFQDGDRFRAWYRCGDNDHSSLTAYAESDDGIAWRKPALGICDYKGSTDNNLCMLDPMALNFAPFKDLNPDVPKEERYKAVARHTADGIFTFTSPDGLRWTRVEPDDHPLFSKTDGPFDSHNIAFHDPWTGQYTMYARSIQAEGTLGHGATRSVKPKSYISFRKCGVRWIRRTVSNDFLHWSPFAQIDTGDAPIEQFYTNACVPYERAPGIYLMFPSRFVDARTPTPDWPYNGVNDGVFMSSRDGIRFDRTFMEAFLRPGFGPNNWHDRSVFIERGILETAPGEMSIFAMEHNRLPTNCIRRWSLRTDGFVSVHAPYAGGECVTKPLIFDGRQLRLNFSTSAAGSIRVELQDELGVPQPGFSLDDCPEYFADEIDLAIGWKSKTDLALLAGKPVRLRFAMHDADLYAFRFCGVEQDKRSRPLVTGCP